MPNPTFDGIDNFFGTQTQTTGPHVKPNVQRSKIPGVAGFRVYNLGTDGVAWSLRGLVTATTLALLEAAINSAAEKMNGDLYTFVTSGGNAYEGCLLNSYAPDGPPFYVKGAIYDDAFEGYAVWVSAVVEWTQPEF